MLLDLNFKLKDMKENEMQDIAHEIVSSILMTQTSHLSPLKAYGLAKKLYNEIGKIEIDATDLDLIYKEVEESKILTNLSKGQILSYIKELLVKNL